MRRVRVAAELSVSPTTLSYRKLFACSRRSAADILAIEKEAVVEAVGRQSRRRIPQRQ
jgi:hypothetical protein